MADRIESKSKHITENAAIAALCIYEFIVESIVKCDKFWCDCQESFGARELRQAVINIAPYIDAAWHTVDKDENQICFDWEFVPTIIKTAAQRDGGKIFDQGAEYWMALTIELTEKKEFSTSD